MNLRVAIADPPYLGKAKALYGKHHKGAGQYDRIEAHAKLIDRLMRFDGWALCLSSVSLPAILPLCPREVRIGAWVKPFCVFKPNVNPAYAWEPVLFYGGRPRTRAQPTVRDWVSCSITLKRGLVGAKPAAFCFWVFELLGLRPGDKLHDLFPGTGAVRRAWKEWQGNEHRAS